jgi:hypothetical protein
VFKGEAVIAAKIPVTVIAMEWQIHPIPAEGTILVNRVFFLPENFRKE